MNGWANALVTGASSGIGRALAIELGRLGVEVIVAARRIDALEEVAGRIRIAGGRARVLRLDVAEEDATVDAIRELDRDIGGLDLVVANAGVGAGDGSPSYAWETLRHAFHTNFCGAAATLTAALPAQVARGRGHVVGIGSLASYGALPESASYCAPKAGLSMLFDCLTLDLAGTGVAVTHVELGFVRTPMVAASRHPMPQIVDADTAARVIVRRLVKRPRRIVHPRALALATRGLAALPQRVREVIARRSRR